MTRVDLASARGRHAWLYRDALPLWWRAGADRVFGGFHESLTSHGVPTGAVRRARVAARQIYVYAEAYRRSGEPAWRQAAAHGLAGLKAYFVRDEDGLLRPLSAPPADPPSGSPLLYDQAFYLFALGACARAGIESRTVLSAARGVFERLDRTWRLLGGGFDSGDMEKWQANPHMHLLEAALMLESADPDGPWRDLADALALLAVSRFIDPDREFVREFFGDNWRVRDDFTGGLVEPGHQFEWAWLLSRYAEDRRSDQTLEMARRLFQIGQDHGLGHGGAVVIDALNSDLSIRKGTARLWPQTEWVKASCRLGDAASVERALRALEPYLQTPLAGLWSDRMLEDGRLVEEPAPASSFYHLACALFELEDGRIHD